MLHETLEGSQREEGGMENAAESPEEKAQKAQKWRLGVISETEGTLSQASIGVENLRLNGEITKEDEEAFRRVRQAIKSAREKNIRDRDHAVAVKENEKIDELKKQIGEITG